MIKYFARSAKQDPLHYIAALKASPVRAHDSKLGTARSSRESFSTGASEA